MGQNNCSSNKKLCKNENSPPNNKKPLSYYSTWTMFQLIPDELLVDILTRLPNARSVFQCTAVCKRWSALISHHRQYLLSSTTTILFRFSRDQSQPFNELFPDRATVESLVLDFLPHYWPNAVIRASCKDTLLVSQGSMGFNYLVCNPRTRRWAALPPQINPWPTNGMNIPSIAVGYGLAISRKESFTVVIFHHSYVSVFKPGARQWVYTYHPHVRVFERLYTKPGFDVVTTAGGAMYWLDGSRRKFSAVVGYNPETNKCQLIQFPCGKRTIARTNRPSKDTICLGIVNGRLRLSRIVKVNKTSTGLKIWEREEKSLWVLIHKVTLKKATHMCFVLAMHPSNENVVFVVCDGEILSLDLQNNVYKMVGEFPCQGEALSDVNQKVSLYMKVFPLVHSLFPTSIQ